MNIEMVGFMLAIVALIFLIAGFLIGKTIGFRNGFEEGKVQGFKQQVFRDVFATGSSFIEIRRLDPSKVRLVVDGESKR